MTEVKGVGRRRTQLLDDLGNRRRHRELEEEVEKMETAVYQSKIRKKYKLSSIFPWIC